MEDKSGSTMLRRPAGGAFVRNMVREAPPEAEDASPEVARENIVKDMMRIFDGLLWCTSKRSGVNLATIRTKVKSAPPVDNSKAASGTQRRLEKEIYQLIKRLVEQDSPNTGFAVNLLFNNGSYYYDKASVPLSFGIFLTSLVSFLEGHDCLSICPEEMANLKTLLNRG